MTRQPLGSLGVDHPTAWTKAFADFTRIYHQITPEKYIMTASANALPKDDDRLDDLITCALETGISLDLIEAVTRGLDHENHDRVLANFRENIRPNFILYREGKS